MLTYCFNLRLGIWWIIHMHITFRHTKTPADHDCISSDIAIVLLLKSVGTPLLTSLAFQRLETLNHRTLQHLKSSKWKMIFELFLNYLWAKPIFLKQNILSKWKCLCCIRLWYLKHVNKNHFYIKVCSENTDMLPVSLLVLFPKKTSVKLTPFCGIYQHCRNGILWKKMVSSKLFQAA